MQIARGSPAIARQHNAIYLSERIYPRVHPGPFQFHGLYVDDTECGASGREEGRFGGKKDRAEITGSREIITHRATRLVDAMWIQSVAEQQQIFDSRGIRCGRASGSGLALYLRDQDSDGGSAGGKKEERKEGRKVARGAEKQEIGEIGWKRKGRMKRNEEGWIHAWEASRNAYNERPWFMWIRGPESL